jgi:hypothetical protein
MVPLRDWIRDANIEEFEVNYVMGIWRQIQEYFYIRKRDPNEPNTQWMRYMHGINRISIFMFLAAIIILLLKLFVFKKH